MQPGDPPPWLFSMQLHGPPPGYPNLTIPGVNAPIPEGAQWGFHRGGWGRPPVDEVCAYEMFCSGFSLLRLST